MNSVAQERIAWIFVAMVAGMIGLWIGDSHGRTTVRDIGFRIVGAMSSACQTEWERAVEAETDSQMNAY